MDCADVPDVHAEAPERAAHRRFRRSHGDAQALSRCAAGKGSEEICAGKERPQEKSQVADSGTDGENRKVLGAIPQRGLLVFVGEPGHKDSVGWKKRSVCAPPSRVWL